jgi:hypothetical protein
VLSERRFKVVKPYSRLLIIGVGALLLLSYFTGNNFNAIPVVAQTFDNATPSPPTSGLPTIQITSLQDGQQVPPGELTIQGISSDDEDADCRVYADANDITPMQNVTAAGNSGEANDYSEWTFTYTQDYQLIKLGENELTAKISCVGESNLNPLSTGNTATSDSSLSEWHTVNVTGVTGAPSASVPLSETSGDSDSDSGDSDSGDSDSDSGDSDSDSGDSDSDSGDSDSGDGAGGEGGGDGGVFMPDLSQFLD